MIEFRSVSKTFGSVKVLDSLSFTVAGGEIGALLGLSGSGKTTALKLICGLRFADSGEVFVQGQRVEPGNLSAIRGLLGYVAQDGGLFPHMTARQNLTLVGRESGWSDERTASRTDELVALTQLSSTLLDQYPRQLSGGQRQRVGLMRALLRDPPILLLDEPMGALDPITRSDLQVELREVFTRLNKTVLLITHDLYEASYLAKKILLLNGGRILQQGSFADLVRNPADEFVRRFVESQRHREGRE